MSVEPEPGCGDGVEREVMASRATVALCRDDPGIDQYSEVLRDTLTSHRGSCSDQPSADLEQGLTIALEQVLNDGQSHRVAQGSKHVIRCHATTIGN